MNKLLFLTAFLPHNAAAAEKNTKIMLEDLSKNFIIDLVYFKYENEPFIEKIKNVNVKHVGIISNANRIVGVLSFPILYPLFLVRFNWKILWKLRRLIKINDYKYVIFDHSQMFIYAKLLQRKELKILISHDVILQRVSRTSKFLVQMFCRFSEKFCLNVTNSIIYTLCQKDSDLIKLYYKFEASKTFVYIAKNANNAFPSNIDKTYIFIGKWSRADNFEGVQWFFDKVVPLIDEIVDIKIIGFDFPKHKINNTNNNVRVSFMGFVDNPYEIIANSKAVLSPLFTGAGIKVKVLESLACGTPVIGTDIAFEGISEKYKEFLFSTSSEFSFWSQMKLLDISLEKRIIMKKLFINDHISESIPDFLRKELC